HGSSNSPKSLILTSYISRPYPPRPDRRNHRHHQGHDHHEAALPHAKGRAVVHPVVRRPPRVRQPSPSPRCLQAEGVTNVSLHRSAGGDPLRERWSAETKSHRSVLF